MPNRIIKESTFTSDKIASLSDFEFRLWVGLITIVDDAGRGDARPAIIKGKIFALRERIAIKDIDQALHGLAAKGCVSLYTVDGKPYFWFPTWSEHQRIRDCKPKCPGPDEDDSLNDNLRQSAATCGELRPESNPIQYNPNTESESNPNTNCANSTVPATPEKPPQYSNAFEEFWKVYPRKVDKGAAYKKYQARRKDGYSDDDLITAAKNYAESCKNLKTEQQYIKHAKTFLSDSTPFADYLKGAPSTNAQDYGQYDEPEGNPYEDWR